MFEPPGEKDLIGPKINFIVKTKKLYFIVKNKVNKIEEKPNHTYFYMYNFPMRIRCGQENTVPFKITLDRNLNNIHVHLFAFYTCTGFCLSGLTIP